MGREKISPSKARGIIALIFLLLAFQIVTFILHKISIGPSDSGDKALSVAEVHPEAHKEAHLEPRLFDFDPNTLPLDSLRLLGFSERQALTIIHYREKGGKFIVKEDFAKVYSVSEQMYERLERYIVIKSLKPKEKAVLKYENREIKRREKEHRSDSSSTPIIEEIPKKTHEPILVELNSADSAELVKVKGIGAYYARQIIRYRTRLGGFVAKEQLLEINRMTPERFAPIAPQVFVDSRLVKKIKFTDTTMSNRSFLFKHPYIGGYVLEGIDLFLKSLSAEESGSLTDLQLLKRMLGSGAINQETFSKLLPYFNDNK